MSAEQLVGIIYTVFVRLRCCTYALLIFLGAAREG